MKTLLCAIGRLENQFIREWVEYNKSIGFDNIYLYDNNFEGEEDFYDAIGDYIDSGYVIIDKSFAGKRNVQFAAYNICYNSHSKDYDWIAFLDCDEFLTFTKCKTIQEYLAQDCFDGAQMVHINWMFYGDCDIIEVSGNTVQDILTEPLPFDMKVDYGCPDNDICKCIVKTGIDGVVFDNTPHNIRTVELDCRNADGKPCNAKSPFVAYTFENAYIRHYSSKGIKNLVEKINRGFADASQLIENRELKQCRQFFMKNKITPEKLAIVKDAFGFTEWQVKTGKKEQCVVVIPVYKNSLSYFELLSFRQCIKVLGNKYHIVLAGPDSVDYNNYFKIAGGCSNLFKSTFDKKYFESNFSYSDLLLAPSFYATFSAYQYMFIYQLDGWIFEDNLQYFIDKKYDYIGGPHFHYGKNKEHVYTVGNGGVSLRNVDKCKEILEKYPSYVKSGGVLEDRFFSEVASAVMTVAPMEEARIFAFHDDPERYYEENGNKLPMAAHAVNKHTEFYCKHIKEWTKVSIIMPVYNMEQYVREAIKSVKAQTYPNIECIVINDGSTDKSQEIILDEISGDNRFIYISQPNAGVAAARNRAIRVSSGELIIPLDSDDQLMNTYAESAAFYMTLHKDCPVFYAQTLMFDQGAHLLDTDYLGYRELLSQNKIPNFAAYRRTDFDRIGGYDQNLPGFEDWEFNIRLLYHNDNVHQEPAIGLLYRNRTDGRNNNSLRKFKEITSQIREKHKPIYEEYGV